MVTFEGQRARSESRERPFYRNDSSAHLIDFIGESTAKVIRKVGLAVAVAVMVAIPIAMITIGKCTRVRRPASRVWWLPPSFILSPSAHRTPLRPSHPLRSSHPQSLPPPNLTPSSPVSPARFTPARLAPQARSTCGTAVVSPMCPSSSSCPAPSGYSRRSLPACCGSSDTSAAPSRTPTRSPPAAAPCAAPASRPPPTSRCSSTASCSPGSSAVSAPVTSLARL